MKCDTTIDDLIKSIYSYMLINQRNRLTEDYFAQRTILCAKNDNVDEINHLILNQFSGTIKTYHSADSVEFEEGVDDVNAQYYPTEYLNSITSSGIPLAHLKLKIGCPIMILRNLDPSNGLCNGTRAILTKCERHVLEVKLLTGEYKGKTAFIPRIKLSPPTDAIGFHLVRKQFPIRLAFAMTINKAQGQSVKYIGLDLRTSVFTHGQFYVAMSRCTSASNIKILFPKNDLSLKTTNIVYQEALIKD